MYKHKLYLFGFLSAAVLVVVLIGVAISAHITQKNLQQNTIAQTLLAEHQQLSSTSYRLFKQLTDELIFGQNANQALVRRKQELINNSLQVIRRLEYEQRAELGLDLTQGSIEDTDELDALLQDIIAEFRAIIELDDATPLNQQVRLRRLLEVTIDNQFRESINSAVSRQNRMVMATNTRIETLNTALVWFTVILCVLVCPFIIFGCVWLFNQLYYPLTVIENGTKVIASGDYDFRLPENLDREFSYLAKALNQLAGRLSEHETSQAQLHQHLQVEVQQRTRELTEANQQLTLQDARRKQFMADISHELRTPLTIIRGESQITLRQSHCEEHIYRDTLQVILDQSVNLSRLVDDLLLLARAEMSQLRMEFVPVNVGELLQQQVNHWQRIQSTRSIHLRLPDTGAASAITIQADQQRLQQVVSILMDNACKYSATTDAVTVALTVDDDRCMIHITDEGAGMSPSELQTVFERFVRFKSKTEGMGLGLAIAKAIVSAHHGDIQVESTQGSGSTFTIVLPKRPPQTTVVEGKFA